MPKKIRINNKPPVKPYRIKPKEIYAEPQPCHPPVPKGE